MGGILSVVIDTSVIEEILKRGNTAEVKTNKDGVLILEVQRTVRIKCMNKRYSERAVSRAERG